MILSFFILLPVLAALAAFLMKKVGSKVFAAVVALTQVLLAARIISNDTDYQSLKCLVSWVPQLGLNWSLGIDGANALLVLLTPLITLLAILSLDRSTPRLATYVASLLLLDGFLCGVFLSQNLGLFYIFFEAMLLPALVLIAGWAKKDGPETALKFLLYTLVGSLPMLLGVLVLAFSDVSTGSLEFSDLTSIAPGRQFYLFCPFLLAFLVKMPIVPLHGWLPQLYRNSPAAVTAVLAALMSKAGTYGLFKVGFTVFPVALGQLSNSLAMLAVISIIYGALSALGAGSVKEVLAYSSLSHIAMIAFGISSVGKLGAAGASLQMAGHAVATGGLFLVVAMMEKRGLPEQLDSFGGLARSNPKLAATALILTLAALGQPGLGSFPGELLILTGTWGEYPQLTLLAALGIVFAAAYLLRWYQSIFMGEMGTYEVSEDLDANEFVILLVPILLSLAIGFCPAIFLTEVQAWLGAAL